MDRPLLTIGDFARAAGLAPSALRHYDEVGLLPPAEVDEATGYRYYTPDQLRRAALVARMREAGIPIDPMRLVLDGTPQERSDALAELVADAAGRSDRTARLMRELSPADAPAPDDASVVVRGPVLAAALRQVRPAAEREASSALSGVLVDVADGQVEVVATNRYWMAVRTLPVTVPSDPGRVVLALDEVDRLVGDLDREDEAELSFSAHGVRLGDREWPVRDVAYPAHRAVLAGLGSATTRALLSAGDVIELVRAVGRSEVRLRLADDGLSIDDSRVPGVVVGPAVTIGFNTALLLRALEATVGQAVELEVSGADRAVRIGSPDQVGFTALVMPIA